MNSVAFLYLQQLRAFDFELMLQMLDMNIHHNVELVYNNQLLLLCYP